MKAEEASEPTDIIWENRHYYESTRNYKRALVYFVIVILLCISAAVIFKFTSISDNLKNKYPTADCGAVFKEFGVNFDTGKVIESEL